MKKIASLKTVAAKTIATLLLAMSINSSGYAIIAGEDALAQTFASQSVVALISSEGGLCTGTLVSLNTVLTAAHCISKNPKSKIAVVFSTSLIGAMKPVVRAATRIIVHPNYTLRQGSRFDTGDIAVVRFEGQAPIGYVPVNIMQLDINMDREKVHLIGYGITQAKSNEGAGTLRFTATTILKTDLSISEAATVETNTGTCQGDSGGPAIIFYNNKIYLWGVTSRGPAECNQFGIYTKTAYYARWINQMISMR